MAPDRHPHRRILAIPDRVRVSRRADQVELPVLAADSATVVLKGAFNPSIFSPAWLLAQDLIGKDEFGAADVAMIQRDIATFKTGWLNLVCTNDGLQLITDLSYEFERCRDVAIGILQTLRHTPLAYIGINRAVHFQLDSDEAWHAIGDTLAPKDYWEDILRFPGMRVLNIQGARPDHYAGRVHVQVEPSALVPRAVFVLHNDHFGLQTVEAQPDSRAELTLTEPEGAIAASADRLPLALEILSNEWAASMSRAEEAIARVAGLAGNRS